MRASDWESAVAYFTKAVQENPDSPEYKINLRRAQEELARQHLEKARQLEAQDQLDGALMEYRKSLELIASPRQRSPSWSARSASASRRAAPSRASKS